MANTPSTSNASKKETGIEDLNEQIAILRDDISALTGTIADLTKAQANELTGAAAQQAEAARKKGIETAALVANQAKDVQTQAQEFVDSRPGTALGIAAGLGFLFGMMSARKQMVGALKYRLRVAVRNAGLIGVGALLLLVAIGFFTAAGWMVLAVAYGPILATLLVGCVYAGLGLVFVGVASRDGPGESRRPEPKPKSTSLMEAFLVGLQAGTNARKR